MLDIESFEPETDEAEKTMTKTYIVVALLTLIALSAARARVSAELVRTANTDTSRARLAA